MIRLLVADDHPVVRDGLRQILARAPDIRIEEEAGSGEEALKKLGRGKFDMVILDISLPGMSGLEVLKRMKALAPGVPVLILSMYPEEHYALRTLKLGASGYLGKENLSSEVVTAVRAVARGRRYLSAALQESLAVDPESWSPKQPHESLSPREYEVMRLIASGETVGSIARQLSLSVKTVDTYRAHVLQKLRLRNNVEIARYALEYRLVA